MENTSAGVLEFNSLRELLRGYASSDLGRARTIGLAPSVDLAWINHQHELTNEIREFRRAGGTFDFSGLIDVTTLLDKSRISGAVLESLEIRDVTAVIERAALWREIAFNPPQGMKSEWSAVRLHYNRVGDFTEFLRGFRNKILPDGTLDDRASPQLAAIRKEIEKQRRAIQESLRGFLRRLAEGDALQEDVVTIRGERFVIPVKSEQKRRVPGVVHGASSSGQTVFVEPLETIEQNNELVRLLEDELEEVHRILQEMTRRIGERAEDIAAALEVLGELELQFAKARFAEDYNCVAPVFSDGSAKAALVLRDARHPLLERNLKSPLVTKNAKDGASDASQRKEAPPREIVPATIELDGDRRELVITGPNTGGKTVALKTAGLLALMAQAGIPVPAARAEMPVFDAVLADIGDYQSI